MVQFTHVTGRFLSPQGTQDTPLMGAVRFHPRSWAKGNNTIYLPDPVIAKLDDEGRIAVDLLSPQSGFEPVRWTWHVDFMLRSKKGHSTPWVGFDFDAPAGETIDLVDVAPVPASSGMFVTRGASAYEVAVSNGFTGSEADWLDSLRGTGTGEVGANGASAYDLWLEAGNSGTAEEFLLSLRGERGADGVVGRDGRDGGEVSGQLHRFFSPITYFWADWYNRDSSKWLRVTRGMPLGFVILNISNGSGESLDPDFLEQSKRARNAGAKLLGYVRTDYGRRDRGEILAEIRNHRDWYQVDGVFLDEAVNGWGEQESLVPAFVELYQDIKAEFGEDLTVVTNPGSNTVQALVDASDVQMCFENSAAKYLDATFPDFYQQYPAERFWHVIHDATVENVHVVLERATYLRAGHLYVTDDKFVPSGDPQSPASNPYDDVPSQAILDAQRYWVTGTDTLDSALAEIPAGADGRSVASITDVDGDGVATILYSDGATAQLPLPRGLQGAPGKDGASATVQDTGWRDVTASFAHIAQTAKSVLLRRAGNVVTLSFQSVTPTATGTFLSEFVPPYGFNPELVDRPQGTFCRDSTPNAQIVSLDYLYTNPKAFRLTVQSALPVRGQMQWYTAEPFPTVLPGAPA